MFSTSAGSPASNNARHSEVKDKPGSLSYEVEEEESSLTSRKDASHPILAIALTLKSGAPGTAVPSVTELATVGPSLLSSDTSTVQQFSRSMKITRTIFSSTTAKDTSFKGPLRTITLSGPSGLQASNTNYELTFVPQYKQTGPRDTLNRGNLLKRFGHIRSLSGISSEDINQVRFKAVTSRGGQEVTY